MGYPIGIMGGTNGHACMRILAWPEECVTQRRICSCWHPQCVSQASLPIPCSTGQLWMSGCCQYSCGRRKKDAACDVNHCIPDQNIPRRKLAVICAETRQAQPLGKEINTPLAQLTQMVGLARTAAVVVAVLLVLAALLSGIEAKHAQQHSKHNVAHSSSVHHQQQHRVAGSSSLRPWSPPRDFSQANSTELSRHVEFFSHIMHTGGTAWCVVITYRGHVVIAMYVWWPCTWMVIQSRCLHPLIHPQVSLAGCSVRPR